VVTGGRMQNAEGSASSLECNQIPTRGRVLETAKSYKNNPKIGSKEWSKEGPEVFFSHQ